MIYSIFCTKFGIIQNVILWWHLMQHQKDDQRLPMIVRNSLGHYWQARLYNVHAYLRPHTHTPIKYISERNLFHVNLHKIFIINSVPIFGGKNKTFFGERIFKPTHFGKIYSKNRVTRKKDTKEKLIRLILDFPI